LLLTGFALFLVEAIVNAMKFKIDNNYRLFLQQKLLVDFFSTIIYWKA